MHQLISFSLQRACMHACAGKVQEGVLVVILKACFITFFLHRYAVPELMLQIPQEGM